MGTLLLLVGVAVAIAVTDYQRRHGDGTTGPHGVRNTVIGLAAGLLLAIASGAVAERRRRLPADAQVEQLSGAPVVGSVPWEHPDVPLVAASRPHTLRARAYRRIGASVADSARVIAVVGAEPRVGASSVAANLGLLLARSDQRIAMIDAGVATSGGADIAKHADAVLLVVRAHRTGHAELRHACNELSSVGAPLVGVVVNGARVKSAVNGAPAPELVSTATTTWIRPEILETPEPTYARPARGQHAAR
jgi:Mrp family chromosome partitioning ATPase